MVLRAIVAVAAASSLLATASPADAGALEDCGQRVIRDWYSGGRVDRVYPLPCYRAAIRALPDDVLQYTDAGAAIERALQSAQQGANARTSTTTDETQAAPTSSAPAAAEVSSPARPARAPDRQPGNPARVASGPADETSASGVPYPLIALGALSVVLLASGIAAGLAHRRH
jgi:hypothetical protein